MAVACLKTANQLYGQSSPSGSLLSSGSSSVTVGGGGGSGASSMNGGGSLAGGAGMGGHLQSQLTRSLERILEDANLSGELKLSGRKLKDFPKAAGKYNLSDTVIADLSRNRFCELPEDITSLAFLERLLVFHNTIRSIPETIRGLHSLTYLDLRNNQLAVLPREICFLPLQVLLLSNNRLVTLPDELGRMEELTELDAACNQITHLPPRMGDLRNLRSLTLRNNQLVYLPRDLTCLQLVFLDISSNKIATLPVELRLMGTLVDLELSNNPLTSPPASLCVRGLVHVFKYLETAAAKEEKSKCGMDGHATLRRSALSSKNSSGSLLDTSSRNRRAHVDSGYSTSDGGFEGKRWSQDDPMHDASPKWSPIPMHTGFVVAGKPPPAAAPAAVGHTNLLLSSAVGANGNGGHGLGGLLDRPLFGAECFGTSGGIGTLEEEFKKAVTLQEQLDRKKAGHSNDISPEGDLTPDSMKSDDKARTLGNIQTYREYKEALRQQRNQTDIYRPKDHQQAHTPDSGGSTGDSPLSNFSPYNKSQATTPSPSMYSSNQSSPLSPHHSNIHKLNQINANGGPAGTSSPLLSPNRNVLFEETGTTTSSNTSTPNKRPVQKVIPSRNITSTYQSSSPTHLNGNHNLSMAPTSNGGSPAGAANGKIPMANGGTPVKTAVSNTTEYAYVKPNSPCKASSGILAHNSVPSSIPKPTNGSSSPNGNQKPLTATVGYVNNAKPGQKTNKTVSWNRDVPTDKLSFTMRREFDKQKEETELIEQLRQIIETRLKMTLPEDIAPSLTDGVVLCHLANHVRPRSVGSIHVPSPAVPKLTMARCRRNVDNFLDACRKIGVDEELICSCQDIVPSCPPPTSTTDWEQQQQQPNQQQEPPPEVEPDTMKPSNPSAMFRTVVAFMRCVELLPPTANLAPTVHHLNRPSAPPPPPPTTSVNHNNRSTSLTAANTNTTTTLTTKTQEENEETLGENCDGEEPNGNSQGFVTNKVSKLLEYHFDQEEQQQQLAAAAEREDVMRVQARLRATSEGEGRNVPGSLDLTEENGRRKRKFPNTRFGNKRQHQQDAAGGNLNEIVEECEYDSDIGKFRCRQDGNEDYEDSEASLNSLDEESAFTPTNDANAMAINDLNTPTGMEPSVAAAAAAARELDLNINLAEEYDPGAGEAKIVSKRIEFFESNAGGGGQKIVNSVGNTLRRSVSEEDNAAEGDEWNRKSDHPVISTILCLGTFLFAVVYLYMYPLPNY